MKTRQSITSRLLVGLALLMSIAPTAALADDDDDHKGKGRKHHNSASPKKNGRHDNRDWNKDRNDDDRDFFANERSFFESQRRSKPISLSQLSNRRQQTKNEWRNIAIASGAIALIGALNNDGRLAFAGTVGALYSLHRYEQDRKSQSKVDRLRASYFSRPYFVRDGRRYDRRLVVKNGVRYYQFCRSDKRS